MSYYRNIVISLRARGRRPAADSRSGHRAELGAASLSRAETVSNLNRVITLSLSAYFWNVTLVSVDGAFPRSSIIDHQSLLNSFFQDSFDVTLACADDF